MGKLGFCEKKERRAEFYGDRGDIVLMIKYSSSMKSCVSMCWKKKNVRHMEFTYGRNSYECLRVCFELVYVCLNVN